MVGACVSRAAARSRSAWLRPRRRAPRSWSHARRRRLEPGAPAEASTRDERLPVRRRTDRAVAGECNQVAGVAPSDFSGRRSLITHPQGAVLQLDISPADWIANRLLPWGRDLGTRACAIVPTGYEAYIRVFHHAEERVGSVAIRRRWHELAQRSGRHMHPAVQFDRFAWPDPPQEGASTERRQRRWCRCSAPTPQPRINAGWQSGTDSAS